MEWYKACVGDFMALEDKLYTVKSTPDVVSHLVPDPEYCRCCKDKPCTYICPAGVYEWQDDKMIVNFENCHLTLFDEMYTLKDHLVLIPTSFSSNEFMHNHATFEFDKGILTVIQSKD